MKILIKLTLLALSSLALNAQTTMCFKENHTNMATIEKVKLDGGLCDGNKSVKEMLKEGWTTNDIKINGNNYVYLFKKANVTQLDMEAIELRVLQRIQKEKIINEKEEKKQVALAKLKNGKDIYNKRCAICHGKNANKQSYGVGPLNKLNLNEFTKAIMEYSNGEREENTTAYLMSPYADMLTPNKVNDVYIYLKSLREKKEDSK